MNDGDKFILRNYRSSYRRYFYDYEGGEDDVLVLDGTDSAGDDAGDQIIRHYSE